MSHQLPKPISKAILQNAKDSGKSAKQLARELGCSGPTVLRYGKMHGVRFSAFKDRGNLAAFQNVLNPDIAYILGFLWADGWIGDQSLSIELVKEDANHLLSILSRHVRPSVYQRHRKEGAIKRRPQTEIHICDARLARFLTSLDYDKKSGAAPTKVLKHIPIRFHRVFWLGYFDGDGHIGLGNYRCSISSTIDQDWNEASKLCDTLGIATWRIRRYIDPNSGHSHSAFIVQRKLAIKPLLDYLYGANRTLALPRKAALYDEYRERLKNTHPRDTLPSCPRVVSHHRADTTRASRATEMQ